MFDLQIEDIESWIRGRGFTSVALQLPEGLKIRATELSDRIFKDTGATVVILGYPCYGACDLFTSYKNYAQGLVHFGHSPIPNLPQDPDVMYVEARAEVDIAESVKRVAGTLPSRIGLLASVQYVGLISKAKEVLESEGKTVFVGRGDSRICYPGQVLGCNCSAAVAVQDEVDCYLFLGEGDFHPLAATFGVERKVVILNPITGEVRSVDDVKDRILRRRFGHRARETCREISGHRMRQDRTVSSDGGGEDIRPSERGWQRGLHAGNGRGVTADPHTVQGGCIRQHGMSQDSHG